MKDGKGPDGIRIRDIPDLRPSRGEIKVKIHACGICGTDLHIFKDELEVNPPVVMGHEYAGTVVAVGEGVERFVVGDRVVSMTTIYSCGACPFCHEGNFHLCETRKALGYLPDKGGFAEYIVVPAAKAFKVAENVTLSEAALSEPLACVVHSIVELGHIRAGDRVFVSGPGTIGLMALQVATACGGIGVIAGTMADRARMLLARELGAIDLILVDSEDVKARSLAMTDDLGFDVAIECAGVARSADTCLRILKKTGRYIQIGLYGAPITFDHDLALKKEISISNGFTSTKTSWERALRLVQHGRIQVKPLISAELPLEEWQAGFTMAANKEGCKVLIKP